MASKKAIFLSHHVEQSALTPTLSLIKRRSTFPCQCTVATDYHKFSLGSEMRLGSGTRRYHFRPACPAKQEHLEVTTNIQQPYPTLASPLMAIILREGTLEVSSELIVRQASKETLSPLRTDWVPEGSYVVSNETDFTKPKTVSPAATSLVWQAIHYHGDLVKTIQEHAGIFSTQPVTFARGPRPLSASAQAALDMVEEGLTRVPQVGSTMVVESAAIQFLALLFQEHPNSLSKDDQHRLSATSQDPRVKNALAYLLSHHQEKITMQELAEASGLSRTHLFTLFQAQVGMSPYQLILQYRLRRAADLLKTTTHSFKEVSALVGYKDPNQFGRMFRHYFKVSPSDMREPTEPPAEPSAVKSKKKVRAKR